MSLYLETHIINIKDDEKVIKFERVFQRAECKHSHIEISEEDNEVLCLDCKTKLNPIWWISKYLKHLNQVTERNNRMLSEAREITKKLENKSKFMCKHCYEVNIIDFKKLPSKAAIERGMSVINEEFEGIRVEAERHG